MSLRPTRGSITVFGRETSTLQRHELPLLRRRIGVVFQDFRLLDHMSIYENVALPLRVRGKDEGNFTGDVVDLLKWVGLGDKLHALPPVLSGGEKQRVAIARALIDQPEVLLADEPTGNVDPHMARRLLRLFLELNRSGTAVVVATHDLGLMEQKKPEQFAAGFEGVTSAQIIGIDETKELLAPWLGAELDISQLPVPRLVVVTIDEDAPPDFVAMSTAISQVVPNATLDDHRTWVARLVSMARTTTFVGIAILVLVLAALVLTVVFATRGALAGNQIVIEVLHFIGARAEFIAQQFQRQFLWIGLRGSLVGGFGALICFAVIQFWAKRNITSAEGAQVSTLFGDFSIDIRSFIGVVLVVILVAALTTITARFTVLRTLYEIDEQRADPYPEAQPNSVSADGIAVLTGGFARLAPAVELIKQKQGQRLLISGSRELAWRIVRFWARSNLWFMKVICGTHHSVTGFENLPEGGYILAPKHQSAWDTFAFLPWWPDPTYILKRELMWIPLFGWYVARMNMIPIDRGSRETAVKSINKGAKKSIEDGRQIVIYPEGTRRPAGAEPAYKSGIYHIYSSTNVQVVPIAHVAGVFWPRRKFLRYPGHLKTEILKPIPPGLSKAEFMERLVGQTEEACDRLLLEVADSENPPPFRKEAQERIATLRAA
ncbi:Cell division ATP-binding protein FtsE [Nymphon striatum]|nr:Cell division ATP-binding protein FtsE [Nymphon striatum]